MDENSEQDPNAIDPSWLELPPPFLDSSDTPGPSKEAWRAIWGTSGNSRWAVLIAAFGFLALFAFAWTRSAVVATEWFSALIAALAFLAFIAAIVTVQLTLPTFRTGLAKPKLELGVQIKTEGGEYYDLLDGTTATLSGCRFQVIMTVANAGNAIAAGGVNLFALDSCVVQPLDRRLKVTEAPLDKVTRRGEDAVPCKVAVARNDFLPGDVPYVYFTSIETPGTGTWPLFLGSIASVPDSRTGRYTADRQEVFANIEIV
jgi:hypothetical protein